jgi:hypothetical protein
MAERGVNARAVSEPGDTLKVWGQIFTAKTDEEQELLALTKPEIEQATRVHYLLILCMNPRRQTRDG